MRVLMLQQDVPCTVGSPLKAGGVAYQAAGLAEALVAVGQDVTFATMQPARRSEDQIAWRRVRAAGIVGRSRVRRSLLSPLAYGVEPVGNYDIVHAHGDSQLLWRRSTPVVRTFHGSARDEALSATSKARRASQTWAAQGERLARLSATVTVGVSQTTVERIGPMDAVVPCGVDTTIFRPAQKAQVPTVLYVGSMGGRKRGLQLLQWFSSGVLPHLASAEMRVVGSPGPPSPGVRYLGFLERSELAGEYAKAWVYASASTYEGFGVPYIESIAAGTPVLTSPNKGAQEVLATIAASAISEDSEYPSRLLRLLQDSEARRAQLEWATPTLTNYSWSSVATRYIELYELAILRKKRLHGD